MKISVSILKEKDDFINAIEKLNNTSTDYIHLDIMDSTFTKNSSFDLNDFYNISTKKYDIHIMSTNLDYQINEAIKLNPEFITLHYESTNSIIKYINLIKENNIKVGLAVSPNTDIDKIKEYLSLVDLVLIMSVEPGLGGQEFILDTVNKLKELNKLKSKFLISVDGGINNETYKYVKDYVDIVVCGSYITNSDNYEEKINTIRNN